MERERDEVLSTYAEYEAASADLRRVMREHEVFLRRLRRKLEQGRSLRESLEGTDFANVWTRVVEQLDHAEKARYRARLASFALLDREHVSIGEISRIWRVSRQLVSRTMREIRR